ncbi:hypothetical protein PYCC9005_003814 [Savitreella phatthalungensis]
MLARNPSADCIDSHMLERCPIPSDNALDVEDQDVPPRVSTAAVGRALSPSYAKSDISSEKSPHIGGDLSDLDDDDDSRLLHSDEAKKMTPKERRQLRNKVSARNFRVRRKEYINHLEALVNTHSSEANTLKQEVANLRRENESLAAELSKLKLTIEESETDIGTKRSIAVSTSNTSGNLDDAVMPMLPMLTRANSSRSATPNLRPDIGLIPTRESFQKDINPWSAGSQFATDWPLSPSTTSQFDFNLNQFTSVFVASTISRPVISEKDLASKSQHITCSGSEPDADDALAWSWAFDHTMQTILGSTWISQVDAV